MILKLIRYSHGPDSTGGILFVDDKFMCYVCEDEKRSHKIVGETRIPAGSYKIGLRNQGGMTKKYAARFPFHKGMLHIIDVPGFEFVYIHIGNDDDDTEGCLLVGYGANFLTGENMVIRSTEAYKDIYLMVLAAMENGEQVSIDIVEI